MSNEANIAFVSIAKKVKAAFEANDTVQGLELLCELGDSLRQLYPDMTPYEFATKGEIFFFYELKLEKKDLSTFAKLVIWANDESLYPSKPKKITDSFLRGIYAFSSLISPINDSEIMFLGRGKEYERDESLEKSIEQLIDRNRSASENTVSSSQITTGIASPHSSFDKEKEAEPLISEVSKERRLNPEEVDKHVNIIYQAFTAHGVQRVRVAKALHSFGCYLTRVYSEIEDPASFSAFDDLAAHAMRHENKRLSDPGFYQADIHFISMARSLIAPGDLKAHNIIVTALNAYDRIVYEGKGKDLNPSTAHFKLDKSSDFIKKYRQALDEIKRYQQEQRHKKKMLTEELKHKEEKARRLDEKNKLLKEINDNIVRVDKKYNALKGKKPLSSKEEHIAKLKQNAAVLQKGLIEIKEDYYQRKASKKLKTILRDIATYEKLRIKEEQERKLEQPEQLAEGQLNDFNKAKSIRALNIAFNELLTAYMTNEEIVYYLAVKFLTRFRDLVEANNYDAATDKDIIVDFEQKFKHILLMIKKKEETAHLIIALQDHCVKYQDKSATIQDLKFWLQRPEDQVDNLIRFYSAWKSKEEVIKQEHETFAYQINKILNAFPLIARIQQTVEIEENIEKTNPACLSNYNPHRHTLVELHASFKEAKKKVKQMFYQPEIDMSRYEEDKKQLSILLTEEKIIKFIVKRSARLTELATKLPDDKVINKEKTLISQCAQELGVLLTDLQRDKSPTPFVKAQIKYREVIGPLYAENAWEQREALLNNAMVLTRELEQLIPTVPITKQIQANNLVKEIKHINKKAATEDMPMLEIRLLYYSALDSAKNRGLNLHQHIGWKNWCGRFLHVIGFGATAVAYAATAGRNTTVLKEYRMHYYQGLLGMTKTCAEIATQMDSRLGPAPDFLKKSSVPITVS